MGLKETLVAYPATVRVCRRPAARAMLLQVGRDITWLGFTSGIHI
jgi:hypothetical protein